MVDSGPPTLAPYSEYPASLDLEMQASTHGSSAPVSLAAPASPLLQFSTQASTTHTRYLEPAAAPTPLGTPHQRLRDAVSSSPPVPARLVKRHMLLQALMHGSTTPLLELALGQPLHVRRSFALVTAAVALVAAAKEACFACLYSDWTEADRWTRLYRCLRRFFGCLYVGLPVLWVLPSILEEAKVWPSKA